MINTLPTKIVITHNRRHQYAAMWLDSQQVARHCGGRYVLGNHHLEF